MEARHFYSALSQQGLNCIKLAYDYISQVTADFINSQCL